MSVFGSPAIFWIIVDFFVADDQLPYDESALEKHLRRPAAAAGLLRKFRGRLAAAPAFDVRSLETLMNDFLQTEDIQLRQVQQRCAWRSRVRVSASACTRRWRFSAGSIAWPASTGCWRGWQGDKKPCL